MTHAQQREFIQLAAVYLACRLRAMGGDVTGLEPRKGPLHFSLLGMRDYAHEMRLLIQEAQCCPACGHEDRLVLRDELH
jgi:hypothetical protein